MFGILRKKHQHRVRKYSGTHASDTLTKSVPAVTKSLQNELNFIHNLPNLTTLHSIINDGVSHDEKHFRRSYKGTYVNSSTFGMQAKHAIKGSRKIRKVIANEVAKKGFKEIDKVTHSPIAVSLGNTTVKVDQLRDVQRMVCEDRKRLRQFVFANSGGGRHHKKRIHRDETSNIRCK